eukprot:6185167-Pleurochrysis_carterae.AAC.2
MQLKLQPDACAPADHDHLCPRGLVWLRPSLGSPPLPPRAHMLFRCCHYVRPAAPALSPLDVCGSCSACALRRPAEYDAPVSEWRQLAEYDSGRRRLAAEYDAAPRRLAEYDRPQLGSWW